MNKRMLLISNVILAGVLIAVAVIGKSYVTVADRERQHALSQRIIAEDLLREAEELKENAQAEKIVWQNRYFVAEKELEECQASK